MSQDADTSQVIRRVLFTEDLLFQLLRGQIVRDVREGDNVVVEIALSDLGFQVIDDIVYRAKMTSKKSFR